jgi:hypothetical protein
MTESNKPWWMYRHLRPLWPLLLQSYGCRRPFVAPILPAVIVGVVAFLSGPSFRGRPFPGGRIGLGVSFLLGIYLMLLVGFLLRRNAAAEERNITQRR